MNEKAAFVLVKRNRTKHEREHDHGNHVFWSPASTCFGVNGTSRIFTPVASKMALAMAAGIGTVDSGPL